MTETDESIQFRFTRHGLSCNNMDEGSGMFGKDWEPSLYDLALEQLKKTAPNEEHLRIKGDFNIEGKYNYDFTFESFKQNSPNIFVFVSPLIRTWETAVLLYGVENPEWTEMNLYIGPYLKEMNKVVLKVKIDRGNYFKSPYEIIPQFYRFLDILISSKHPALNLNISKKTINLFWPSFTKFDIKKPKFLKFSFTIASNDTLTSMATTNPMFKQPKKGSPTGVGEIENYEVTGVEEIEDEVKGGGYTLGLVESRPPDFSIFDYEPHGRMVEEQFAENGNLQKFMETFHQRSLFIGYPDSLIVNNVVHVVTHSKVMQEHLYVKYGIDISSSPSEHLRKIRGSNNWTFIDKVGKVKDDMSVEYSDIVKKLKKTFKEVKKKKKQFEEKLNEERKNMGYTEYNTLISFMNQYISSLQMKIGVPSHSTRIEVNKKGVLWGSKTKSVTLKKGRQQYISEENRKFCGTKEKRDVEQNYSLSKILKNTSGGKRSKKRFIRGKVTKKNRKNQKTHKRK